MGTDRWAEAFEILLRRNLSLRDDQSIPEGVQLIDLGLDSFSAVALVVEIEDTFEVQFPDELLAVETFATPGALWKAVCTLQAARSPEGRG